MKRVWRNYAERAILKLYNTLTRSLEEFKPAGDRIKIYVCGLTPSAEAHLGHARSFMFFDVLRRYLRALGYELTFVQNVTDIDDRSIAAAKESGEDWRAIVKRNYDSFSASMRKLGVLEPDEEPHATQYIPEIQTMIRTLVDRGFAYATDDGVYFSVKRDPEYGRLSHKNVDELLVGARIEENEHKRDPLDFALWKYAKPDEPQWAFDGFGAGRPGWHIECSAMAHALLGEPLDIHGGGFDLVFPHHENEIAQTKSALGKDLSRFWVHGGLLNFENRKMSKSLGNFEPLYRLLERHDPQAIRLLFLQTGYRKPMNFTEESIAAATVTLGTIKRGYRKLHEAAHGQKADVPRRTAFLSEPFLAALADDMNTSVALSKALASASGTEELIAQHTSAAYALREYFDVLDVLGLTPNESWLKDEERDVSLPIDLVDRLHRELAGVVSLNGGSPEAAIEKVIAARNDARRAKDFALADRLRDVLAAQRIVLKDSREGTSWSVEG